MPTQLLPSHTFVFLHGIKFHYLIKYMVCCNFCKATWLFHFPFQYSTQSIPYCIAACVSHISFSDVHTGSRSISFLQLHLLLAHAHLIAILLSYAVCSLSWLVLKNNLFLEAVTVVILCSFQLLDLCALFRLVEASTLRSDCFRASNVGSVPHIRSLGKYCNLCNCQNDSNRSHGCNSLQFLIIGSLRAFPAC